MLSFTHARTHGLNGNSRTSNGRSVDHITRGRVMALLVVVVMRNRTVLAMPEVVVVFAAEQGGLGHHVIAELCITCRIAVACWRGRQRL